MKQQPSKLVNGALLSGTLRTFQKAACDDQIVTLRCPTGTCISIELAHYGNTAGPAAAALCRHHTDQSNQTCLWPNALQYSLLQTVVEACQNKQQCKFHTSPKTFGGDPCPGVHKYVEVAYKCRPYEFRSKVACQNDALQLKCNPPTRIAIYSASFGRTEYESARCPQPQGVREETCLVSYATETVIQICHGKAHCSLSADTATFGNPCHKDSRMYLKLVFTCVPRRVLREPYDNRLEVDNVDGDIIDDPDYDIDYGTIGDTVIYRDRGSDSSYSPSPKLSAPNISGNTSLLQPPPSHVSPSPPQNERSSKENQEKLILYLILSVSGGLLSILTLVIGRLLWQRRTTHQRAKYHASAATTTLPNGFADDISEIDADIGLTTVNTPPVTMIIPSQMPSHHSHSHSHSPSEVVRYGGGDSNAPRSLSRSGNSQYYYG
ncbi:protein eva-1 homolog C-like isoform X2 [Lycorma delicatula]|uniref:protein eva-1 homolog C-like isoform X2 n=1 Tax=Lycorma delicatula TaxID=130591 RepID=UPI003F5193F0